MFEYLDLFDYEVRWKNRHLNIGNDEFRDSTGIYKMICDERYDDVYIIKDGKPVAVSYNGKPFYETDDYLDID